MMREDLIDYYGLLELGELGGMWKNVAGRYEMNGKKIYGKEILKKSPHNTLQMI